MSVPLVFDKLVEMLESNSQKYKIQVDKDLISVMRYAIFTPISLIEGAARLITKHTQSVPVREWAKQCNETVRHWTENYHKTQQNCLNSTAVDTEACQCIAQNIQFVIADSQKFLDDRERILNNLTSDDLKDAGQILFEQMSIVTQIYHQLHMDDWTWLLKYINQQIEIRSDNT